MSDNNESPREMTLLEIATQCLLDSQRWFSFPGFDGTYESGVRATGYYVLAAGGEAGEMQNKFKKVVRGDKPYYEMADEILEEGMDVFIYLMNIFAVNGVDPMALYLQKRAFNEERWGPKVQVPAQADARD